MLEAMDSGSEDVYANMDLEMALEELPTMYRSVITLRYFEDLKIDEIAEVLNENISTIKTRLYQALRLLRIRMTEEDLGRYAKMDRKLDEMKQQYRDIPIPNELDFIVNKAIKQHTKKKSSLKWLTAAAAAVIILVTSINTSPAFAHALSEVPLVGT